MSDGNWKVGLIMDDGTSEEQGKVLGAVFGGEKGGPMEMVASLIGEMLGVESMPISYEDDGFHKLKVGDWIDMEVEDFVPEGESEPSRLTGIHHPSASTLTVARDSLQDRGVRHDVRERGQERALGAVFLVGVAA